MREVNRQKTMANNDCGTFWKNLKDFCDDAKIFKPHFPKAQGTFIVMDSQKGKYN